MNEIEQLKQQLADTKQTLASLQNRIGDNLCHLQDPENDPIPPKSEFLESCSRFWDYRSQYGVLKDCKTIAALEEENSQLKHQLEVLQNGPQGQLFDCPHCGSRMRLWKETN